MDFDDFERKRQLGLIDNLDKLAARIWPDGAEMLNIILVHNFHVDCLFAI